MGVFWTIVIVWTIIGFLTNWGYGYGNNNNDHTGDGYYPDDYDDEYQDGYEDHDNDDYDNRHDL
jgi:hypothetical protein